MENKNQFIKRREEFIFSFELKKRKNMVLL